MYARTSTASYPARNMQNYSYGSYSGDQKYPKGTQNTQQAGYGDHQNYMESSQSYGVRKDGRTQQQGYSHSYQEDDTYGNMPSSSGYDHGQSYQETEYHDQGGYTEDKRDNRKGSWNTSSWDMNRGSNYSSSEPVTYPEASSSYQQQQHHNRYGHGSWGNVDSRANGSGGRQAKTAPYGNKDMKFKGPPKQQQYQQQQQPPPQQLHYCEICKISCAGYQTYKEHLEGQKHKKKELTVTAQMPVRGSNTQLHCQLCDISCTGPDAYAAHIKGAKHQKVVKLHTRLGKPIPDSDPVMTHTATSGASSKTPSFNSPGVQNVENSYSLEHSANTASSIVPSSSKQHVLEKEGRGDGQDMLYENPVQPVGESYVEEVRNEDGKIIRFHCKLCECSFNDSNARDMHLKGRRHRLQYKKKVNPRLPVEVKTSNRPWKTQEDKLWRRWEQRQAMQRYLEEEQMWLIEMRRYEDMYRRELEEEYLFWEYQQMRQMSVEWPRMGRGVPPYSLYGRPQLNESKEDQYIMRKHAQIYPTEKELQAIQKTVLLSERALKLVSDCIKEEASAKNSGKLDAACLLRGVKRVGILAKGLILHGNQDLHLTLICSNKPTHSLLKRIAEILPEQLEKLSKKQHTVTYDVDEAHLLITFLDEPKMNITVSLTCSDLSANKEEKKENVEKKEEETKEEETKEEETKEETKEEETKEEETKEEETKEKEEEKKEEEMEKEDKDDSTSEENILLNEEKCKESLVHLRQAQWFQVHISNLQSSVIIIRIFHDLRRREPAWKPLHDWALEVIIEKALRSASMPLSPADATRRVLECIAFGVLLPDGPGLQDPCKKEPCDVLELLTNQEREDITAIAQQALRMMSFRQIYKVLGMEPLQSSRVNRQKRKRPRDNNDIAKGDEKKDKKENTEQTE